MKEDDTSYILDAIKRRTRSSVVGRGAVLELGMHQLYLLEKEPSFSLYRFRTN